MSIFDNIFRLIQPLGSSESLEDFQKSDPVQKVESNLPATGQDAFHYPSSGVIDIGTWSFKNSQNIDYSLAKFKCDLNSYYLEETIAELIDFAIAKVAPISNIYTKHLDFADTDINIEIKFKGYSEEESQALYANLSEKITRLYPDCHTERDTSRFRMGRLLKDGVFSSQKWIDETNSYIEAIKLIPPYQLRWKNIEDVEFINSDKAKELAESGYTFFRDWLPYQKTAKRGEIYIHPKGFIYKPLYPIVTDKGKFFIPPLLAAIAHLPAYQMFNQSIENIGKNVGYHKQLRTLMDADAMKVLAEAPEVNFPAVNDVTGKVEEMNLIGYLATVIKDLKTKINNTLKTAVIGVPPGVKIEEGSSFDVPSNLQDLKDLLVSEMVVGGKSYMNIIGYPGQVNQTTLADAQKQTMKNQIESLQAANLSIHKHDIITQAGLEGLILEYWKAYHEPPNFDTEVQREAARKIQLENEEREERIKSGIVANNQALEDEDEQKNLQA